MSASVGQTRVGDAVRGVIALCCVTSCSVPETDYTGKRCPCPSEYTCDPAHGVCVRGAADSAPNRLLPSGLLGYWAFNDGAGTVATDATPLGRHGVLPDFGVSWSSDAVSGGALSFDNPDAGVSMADWDEAAFPEEGTLALWVKASFPVGGESRARNLFDGFGPSRSHLFVRRANGEPDVVLQCALQRADAPYAMSKSVPVQSDAWQLVAVGWSVAAKTAFCYVQGNRQLESFTTEWFPTQQRFAIGQYVIGVIDEVRLYDHLLDDKELALLLAAGA